MVMPPAVSGAHDRQQQQQQSQQQSLLRSLSQMPSWLF
jgi:hypothetical protein